MSAAALAVAAGGLFWGHAALSRDAGPAGGQVVHVVERHEESTGGQVVCVTRFSDGTVAGSSTGGGC